MIAIEEIQKGDFFTNAAHTWVGEVVEVRCVFGKYEVKLGSLKNGTGMWFDFEDLERVKIDREVLLASPGFEPVTGPENTTQWKVRTENGEAELYLAGDGSLGTYTDGRFIPLAHVEYIDELQHFLRKRGVKMVGDIPREKKPDGFVFVTPLSGDQLGACIDFLIQDRRVWNASDFARMIGVAKSLVSDVRSGKKPFSEKLAEKICKAFPEVILR